MVDLSLAGDYLESALEVSMTDMDVLKQSSRNRIHFFLASTNLLSAYLFIYEKIGRSILGR